MRTHPHHTLPVLLAMSNANFEDEYCQLVDPKKGNQERILKPNGNALVRTICEDALKPIADPLIQNNNNRPAQQVQSKKRKGAAPEPPTKRGKFIDESLNPISSTSVLFTIVHLILMRLLDFITSFKDLANREKNHT